MSTPEMSQFDWQTWIDNERQAAEQRVGSVEAEVVTLDQRYDAALTIWARWQNAQREATAALADARRFS